MNLKRQIRLRRASVLMALLALGILAPPLAIAAPSQSSPTDLKRFVEVTKKMEAAPLDPAIADDREWALGWLTDAPDVNVNVCGAPMGEQDKPAYKYAPQMLYQYMFSMGSMLIEHPELAKDMKAQYAAGVDGMLRGYRSILKTEPNARSAGLDALVELQSKGGLQAFVETATIRCLGGARQPT